MNFKNPFDLTLEEWTTGKKLREEHLKMQSKMVFLNWEDYGDSSIIGKVVLVNEKAFRIQRFATNSELGLDSNGQHIHNFAMNKVIVEEVIGTFLPTEVFAQKDGIIKWEQ